ncbi:hypothetical protein [Bradyrhizobium sp. AT1]|uniref:hypothetical protein n=1 Tax=Bradyrhizobium sp. AT1 TaxID=574934 RepID=UPI0012EE38C6|nr:hypothetical protein [Bradyrhizobium sp. AT1]
MFKVIERSDFTEIHLRHVPEGHLYIFQVIIVGGRHLIKSGKMAENAHSHTAAFRYARQAKEFAAEVASQRDYLLLPLERFASPILVEAPASEDESPAPAAQSLQSPQARGGSSLFSSLMGMLLFVGLLVLLFALSR